MIWGLSEESMLFLSMEVMDNTFTSTGSIDNIYLNSGLPAATLSHRPFSQHLADLDKVRETETGSRKAQVKWTNHNNPTKSTECKEMSSTLKKSLVFFLFLSLFPFIQPIGPSPLSFASLHFFLSVLFNTLFKDTTEAHTFPHTFLYIPPSQYPNKK